jgi:hypothetical protein
MKILYYIIFMMPSLPRLYLKTCICFYIFNQVNNYEKELEEMKHMTRQEFVASLRRSVPNPLYMHI